MAERWYLPFDYGGVEMTVNPTGDYVRYTDYARLQEQVEAYRQSSVHPDDYAAAITRAEAAEAERDRLREALRALLDCPDIADNDYKDEETHAAERVARAALQKEPQPPAQERDDGR